ncbi:hypothetical protein D3C81_1644120 [compost metagenome]
MSHVGDQFALCSLRRRNSIEAGLEAVPHVVELIGQLAELLQPGILDPCLQIAFSNTSCPFADPLNRGFQRPYQHEVQQRRYQTRADRSDRQPDKLLPVQQHISIKRQQQQNDHRDADQVGQQEVGPQLHRSCPLASSL